MIKKITLSIALLFFAISSNAQWWGNSKKIKGNGNLVTVTRSVSNYDKIGLGGSFDVLLVEGKEGNITIEGEENIIPYIETNVKGSMLEIKFQKNTNIRTTRKLLVTVPYKDLDRISLGGSGNISNEGIIKGNYLKVTLSGSGNIKLNVDTNETDSSISGSGNIKLTGNSDEFNCSVTGSGSTKAYELITDKLYATIAGSGSIRTTVNTKIKAKIVGSGSIYYKGTPKYIDAKTTGSGDVIDRN